MQRRNQRERRDLDRPPKRYASVSILEGHRRFIRNIYLALSTLAKKINKKDRYIMGDTPSFADIVVVSLTNMVATFTPKDWEGRVSQWDDGKWAALHATCSGWKKID